jgi:putative aldouronate transport system substrate-binding protein
MKPGAKWSKATMSLCLMLVLSLAGCVSGGGEKSAGDKAEGNPSKAEPFKITMMNIFGDPEPPKKDNEGLRRVEEYTGTDLDITWVPSSAYFGKMNAAIASGTMPEVLMALELISTIKDGIDSGMFWEIGPYLNNYPNLSQLPRQVLDNTSHNGKVYAIPRLRDLARAGITIRKDWLDNLGLPEPKTVDDLYNVAKAFTYDDPDRNGKNDTYGITAQSSLEFVRQMGVYMGGPNARGIRDGKVEPDFLFPKYMDALTLLRKMYAEKLIKQDFAVTQVQDRRSAFIQGKAGISFATVEEPYTSLQNVTRLNPEARIIEIGPLAGPDGLRTPATDGYYGMFLFPKSAVKTEEQLKRILTYLDKLGDEKMQNLFKWGIEGKHYTMKNGKPTQTADQSAAYSRDMNGMKNVSWALNTKAMTGEVAPLAALADKLKAQNEQYAIPVVNSPYESKTAPKVSATINSIMQDAKTKYIMGEIDLDGFNKAIDQWRSNGGDQIIAEYARQYVANEGTVHD